MRSGKALKTRLPELALGIFLAVSLLLVGLIHHNPGLTRYAYAPYSFFMLQPEEVTEETIPAYAGVRRNYTFTIPEGSAVNIGARISFYLRHTNATLSIEDSELTYDSSEHDTPHIGHTPGNYWVTVPVRSNYAGKTLHITLTPVFQSVRNETPTFYLIGHEQLLTMLLIPEDGLMLSLCAAAAVTGCFLILTAFLMPLKHEDRRRIALLGAIAIATSIWKLTGLSSVALMLDSYGVHKELWYLGAVMYLVTLTLSLRFLILLREDGSSRTGMICFGVALTSAFFLILLQLANLVELHSVLVAYGIFSAVLHLIALFERKPTRRQLVWGLPFLLMLGVDLLLLARSGSMHNAPFFMLWIIANLFIQGFGFARSAILRERLLREKEEELRNARISSLMQQIRPHFIYNTLTSIYVLCRDNPTMAMQVVQDFTAYLQANFTAIAATEPIPFPEELRHTKSYLAVESIRYGERLSVAFDTKHTAFRLPALTLQPIVENAVKHSLSQAKGKMVQITVSTRAEDGWSIITVTDNGPGLEMKKDDSEFHIGLQNVQNRLRMMSGGELTLQSIPALGTTVTVRIPQN
jgi:hypothetical protein